MILCLHLAHFFLGGGEESFKASFGLRCLGPGVFRFGGMSTARLDAFARGRISAFAEEGHSAATIPGKMRKKDGTRPGKRSVEKTPKKFRICRKWRGTDSRAGGRPPEIS